MADRYKTARGAVLDGFIAPVVELLNAADAAVADAMDRAEWAETRYSVLHEQRGFDEPDFSARIALSQLWELLGAKDQTAAVDRLRDLLEKSTF